ncbi:hypothetical protein [Planctomicrobium sp. SH664]|uniref:hypothetical protein n=1 Tax=Planctomicrobium sp. SH664 TaxID=3448125 RepID=UPI003F5AE055
MSLRQWWQHAFALDQGTPPTKEDLQIVDALAREVVRRQMAPPALMFLEMSRPLNVLGAQALNFFAPFVTSILPEASEPTPTNSTAKASVRLSADSYQRFSRFLERRDAIELLCQRIEFWDAADGNHSETPSQPTI